MLAPIERATRRIYVVAPGLEGYGRKEVLRRLCALREFKAVFPRSNIRYDPILFYFSGIPLRKVLWEFIRDGIKGGYWRCNCTTMLITWVVSAIGATVLLGDAVKGVLLSTFAVVFFTVVEILVRVIFCVLLPYIYNKIVVGATRAKHSEVYLCEDIPNDAIIIIDDRAFAEKKVLGGMRVPVVGSFEYVKEVPLDEGERIFWEYVSKSERVYTSSSANK